MLMVKNHFWHAQNAKTAKSQQRRHDLYQRTDEYKQVAMCSPNLSFCAVWPMLKLVYKQTLFSLALGMCINMVTHVVNVESCLL